MVNEQDNGERIAALEAQIAAMADIKAAIVRLEAKLDAYQTNYVPRAEISEMFRSRDEKIARIEEEAKEKRRTWPNWVGTIIAAAALLYSFYHGGK